MNTENFDASLCVEPEMINIQVYLQHVLCSLLLLEWQVDKKIIAELQNAGDCCYVRLERSENKIGISWGTTYTSDNVEAQQIIDWVIGYRANAILGTLAPEEISNAVQSHPESIVDSISKELQTVLNKGG